jgi:hypothetical protein
MWRSPLRVCQYDGKVDSLAQNGPGNFANGPYGRREVEQFQLKEAFVAMRDGPMVQFKRRAH